MARYFVTGATGFIGTEVVRQLLGAGHDVVALVRQPARAGDLMTLGVDVRPGDVTEPDTIAPAMAGADGVFHVAGWYQVGVRDKSAARRVNVDGTRNVLTAMHALGIPKGVYVSTLTVFGDTHGQVVDESYFHDGPYLSEYDHTKWLAHYAVALPMIREGLPLVIVQPGGVYGPGDPSALGQTLRNYLRRRLPAVPRGSAYCWGHVEDTARGLLLAMDRGRPGESYIIAGPPATLIDALTIAQRLTGIPAPRLQAPAALLKGLAALAEAVERVIPLPQAYSGEYLRVAAGVTYLGSSAKAARELGFHTRPIETGLRETLEAERQRLRR
jgi:nucleoside-diphosphate-sugar epimerase